MRLLATHPCAVAICLLLLAAPAGPAAGQDWQQKHTLEELLSLATGAYQTLPEVPSPADAKPFLVAMANLFAYAQVSPRMASDPAHAAEVRGALEWLTSNLGNVVPAGGKGDDPNPLGPVERRGLAAYDSVRNRQSRLATPFRSYAAAVTNLYVVRQAASTPSQEAFGALGWLRDNPVSLAPGVSGKADEAGGAGPTLPTRPKPALFGAGPARGGAFDVVLRDAGTRKIQVIKAIRATTGIGLAASKGLVDRAPSTIRAGVSKAEAERTRNLLEAQGATVQVNPSQGPSPGADDLSGRWTANDGGTYYVRQIGQEVWWYGESGDGGQGWSNVFQGSFDPSNRVLKGHWTDVPKGTTRGSGVLALRLSDDGRELTALQRTGGFGGSVWRR